MSFNNTFDKRELREKVNRASEDFGTGDFLMRPEDTSIQGASEDFMKYLQNPFSEVEQNIEDDNVTKEASLERNNFDALKGNGTPLLPEKTVENEQQINVPPTAPNLGANKPNIGLSNSSLPSVDNEPKQLDILEQLKAARAANEAAMLAAKQSDMSTDLGNVIMQSGAMAGEGIVNRSGNTKIKLDPLQVKSNEVDFAGSANKGRLDALMQEYGIKKGIDDTAYNRKKDEQDRKDRLNARAEEMKLKREEMDYKKKNDAAAKTLAKEEVKEGIQISKENRKVRRDLDESIPALESQLQNIKEAKAMLMDNPQTGKTGVATGPVDQYYSKFTKEGQTLEKKLNKISLDTMVKMFSGMSKAVDTNAERAQFQSTQPQMRDYQDVNIDTLTKLENSINSVIKKTNAARQLYDRTGDFTQPEEKQSNVAPKNDNSSYPKKVFNNKGQSATVSNAQEEAEAKSEGFN